MIILKVGDEVKVKVLSIDEEAGKIGLSIRATEEAPAQVAESKSNHAKTTQASSNYQSISNQSKDLIH